MDHVEVLPPLPKPAKRVIATGKNTAAVRNGVEMGGYVKESWYSEDQMRAYAIAALSAKPEGEAVGYMRVGIFGDLRFNPLDSVKYMPEGSYQLYISLPGAHNIRIDEPLDVGSGADGSWYCEDHPGQLQGHGGCDGAGIPACARIGLLAHQIRMLQQRLREQKFMYGFLADAAFAAAHGEGDPAGTHTATPCLWIQDVNDGSWDTACGNKHVFIDGDSSDNLHSFCPYCGGRIFEPNEDAPLEVS